MTILFIALVVFGPSLLAVLAVLSEERRLR